MTPAEFTSSGIWISNHFSISSYVSWATIAANEVANPGTHLTSLWNPTKLDFDEWMDWAEKLGAVGALLVAKHPDGFCLWPSQVAWSGAKRTIAEAPWYNAFGQVDVLGLWCATARRHGLRVGLYYSPWDEFRELVIGGNPTTVGTVNYTAWTVAQLTELLTNYGEIDFLLLDGWGNTWPALGGIGFGDVPYQTIRNLVTSLQPGCVLAVNDHQRGNEATLYGDVSLWEHSATDGEPLAGQITNFPAAVLWDPVRATGQGVSWFDHADNPTLAATDAGKHLSRKYRMKNYPGRDIVYLLNMPSGLDGKLASDTLLAVQEMTKPQRPLIAADYFALAPTAAAGVGLNAHVSQYDGGTWSRTFGSVQAVIDPYGEMRVNDAVGAQYSYSVAPGSADYQAEVEFKLLTVPSLFTITPLVHVVDGTHDNRWKIDWNGTLFSFALQRNNAGLTQIAYIDGSSIANQGNGNVPAFVPTVGPRYRAVLRKVGNTLTGELWLDPAGGTDFEILYQAIATESVITGAGSAALYLAGLSSATTGLHVTAWRMRGIDTLAPTAPVLAAPLTRSDGVLLRWSGAPADLWKYKVYRSVDGVTYSFLGNTATSEFFDDTAALGVEYKYQVKAVDTSYNVSPASNVVAGSLAEEIQTVDFTEDDRARLNALVPVLLPSTTGGIVVDSTTEYTFAFAWSGFNPTVGPYIGDDVIFYDESQNRRQSRRRIVASQILSGVALKITVDAAPDFTVAGDDSLAIVRAASYFGQLSEEIATSGANQRPVNQTSVPLSRTWLLKSVDGEGLVGELPLTIKASEIGRMFAADFRSDLSTNGRVATIVSVELISGTANGITLEADLDNRAYYGVDRSQAKFLITPLLAGEYVLRIEVTYDPADGGGNTADVTLIVT